MCRGNAYYVQLLGDPCQWQWGANRSYKFCVPGGSSAVGAMTAQVADSSVISCCGYVNGSNWSLTPHYRGMAQIA
jgi:hypothetical protein